jgi:histone H1/5
MTATPKAAAPEKKSAPKKVTKVEKKSKVTKTEKKAKTASSHPPFQQMVKKAIAELKEKGGSSRQAVLKYVCANYKVEAKSGNKYVKVALVSGVKNNALKRVGGKGVGANGSFKLVEEVMKAAKPKEKKESAPKAEKSAKPKAKKVVKRVSKPKPAKKAAAAKKPAKPKAKSVKKPKAAAPKKA